MFETIGMLVVAIIVIAVAVAIIALAVKIALMLLPVALLVGGICLFMVCFCSDNNGVVEAGNVRTRDLAQQEFHRSVVSLTLQKWGVNLESLRPEIDSAIAVVVQAYCDMAEDDGFKPLITSANDFDGHAAKSAHYAGAAIDFRIKDMGSLADRRELVQMIRDGLDERFLVLHEDIGKMNEHLHIQLKRQFYNRNVVWR